MKSMTVLRATVFETLPRAWKHPPKTATRSPTTTNILNRKQFFQSGTVMASSNSQINASQTLRDLPVSDAIAPDNLADYGVENADIKSVPGVDLSNTQRLLTGSVLDVSLDQSYDILQDADMTSQ
jgi:hypothetical protein